MNLARTMVVGCALVGALLVGSLAGCSTYRADLDRAMAHYHARSYDRALALLEVLEPDIDSLSEAERAQYDFYRGMSHFLLEQRLHARHWLGLAAAREKGQEGSLNPDEKKKVGDTLEDLNKDRYGGSEVPAPERVKCNVDTDCVKGQFCDNGVCKKPPADADKAPADKTDAENTDDNRPNGDPTDAED